MQGFRLKFFLKSLPFSSASGGNTTRSCAFTKGQLISKANYLDLDSSKKQTKYLPNSALATRAEVLGLFFRRIENK